MMWARVIEFMLGCWLAISPFVFQHGAANLLWAMDFIAASLVIGLALVSYWSPLRHAHLGIVVVALLMILFGWLAGRPEPGPPFQNHILVGLLLLMFAIVPNHASRPPSIWYARNSES